MKKIKVGIIGAGWVARRHLEVSRAVKGIEIVGIASRTKSKAAVLAREFKTRVFADAKGLWAETKPDALMILVSPDQTYRVASSLIPLGLPLFIEKPAGMTPRENSKLARLAKKYKTKALVGYNRRFYSIFHKGLSIIKKHGPLLGVLVEGNERIWRVRGAKRYSAKILANWIFVNGTHTIDLLRFFGGEIEEVKSVSARHKEKRGDQFSASLKFKSGALGHYLAHWHSPAGWRVVLYGNGVTVKFDPLEKGVWVDKNFKEHTILPEACDVRFKPGFFRQMEAFGRLVKSSVREWPMLDLEGSYKTMLLAKEISANSRHSFQKTKIS